MEEGKGRRGVGMNNEKRIFRKIVLKILGIFFKQFTTDDQSLFIFSQVCLLIKNFLQILQFFFNY